MFRKRLMLLAILFITGALLSVSSAFAQTVFNVNKLDISQFPNANVLASIINTDKDVVPVYSLNASDFSVYEDRSAIENVGVKLFEETSYGVSIVIVIDASGSIKGNALAKVKSEIGRFVSELRPQDSVAILSFNDNIRIASFRQMPNGKSYFDGFKDDEKFPPEVPESTKLMFTNDPAEFAKAVNSVEIGGKISVLFQAVKRAIDIASKSSGIYKGVVVISDGHNEDPAYNDINLCLKTAKEKAIPVSSMGVGWDDSKWLQFMVMFAEETGGIYRHIDNPDQIGKAFNTLKNLLMKQYVFSFMFDKIKGDGKEHELTIIANINGQKNTVQHIFKSPFKDDSPLIKIQSALDNDPELSGKIFVKEVGKKIVLSGNVSSKNLKKVAKEIALKASPKSKIDNSDIKVVKGEYIPKDKIETDGFWAKIKKNIRLIMIIAVSAIVVIFAVFIAWKSIRKGKEEEDEDEGENEGEEEEKEAVAVEDEQEEKKEEENDFPESLDEQIKEEASSESVQEEEKTISETTEDKQDSYPSDETSDEPVTHLDSPVVESENTAETPIQEEKTDTKWGTMIVTKEGFDDKVYDLTKDQIIIGTEPDDDIVLDEETLGSFKVLLNYSQENGAEIEHYADENLVLVNRNPTKNAKLSNTDLIQIGSYNLIFKTDN